MSVEFHIFLESCPPEQWQYISLRQDSITASLDDLFMITIVSGSN